MGKIIKSFSEFSDNNHQVDEVPNKVVAPGADIDEDGAENGEKWKSYGIPPKAPDRSGYLKRPLDAPYVVDNIMSYVEQLMDDGDDIEVAMELKQVGRTVRAQYPNNKDISVYDVFDIAEEQGMDKDVLDKVKKEIEIIWTGI